MTAGTVIPYGPFAARIARGMKCAGTVIVSDRSGLTAAAAEAFRRRSRNEPFFVRFLLSTEEALRLEVVASHIVAPNNSLDEARELWQAACYGTLHANEQPLHSIAIYSDAERKLLSATLRLADGHAASSEAERWYVGNLGTTSNVPFLRAVGYDATVPAPANIPAGGDSIVVWAPDLAGDAALAFVLPLLDFKTPIVVISATDPQRPGIASFYRLEAASALLERSGVIVDTSSYGADTSLSLARWGRPLVSDVRAGSHEVLNGALHYSRRNAASLVDAVATALGAAAPATFASAGASSPPARVESAGSEPLVSVIIPTYDRKDLLRLALDSVRRQTFRNIQTIVVVDGGPRLDDFAKEYTDVQFLHNPVNDRYERSKMGFAAAKGVYVNFLNDDDLFLPNHVETLVVALERGRSPMAHTDVITAYLRGSSDSGWELYGIDNAMCTSVDPTELLIGNCIDFISCMFRRDLLTAEDAIDRDVPFFVDYPLWLKFARTRDFIHVPRITACYTIRNRGEQQHSIASSDRRLAGFEALYRREPVTNRPTLQRRRDAYLHDIQTGAIGLILDAPAQLPAHRWPLWS